MIIYTVNAGHYPTFKAASDARKKLPDGNYTVFRCGDIYTIKLYFTPKKESAYELAEKLQSRGMDVWIEERNTKIGGPGE